MLVLSRRLTEKLYFPGIRLIIHVLSVRRGAVRLGIEAPPEVTILREEVQSPPAAGQLPGTETAGGAHDVTRRAEVCRPCRHPHHRTLLCTQGGRRRGGGPTNRHPCAGAEAVTTGITNYLQNGGTLGKAQARANHESARTGLSSRKG